MTPATAARGEAGIDAPLSATTEVLSESVGFSVQVAVGDRVPDALADDLLATMRERLVDERGNLLFQAVRVGHGILRSYGSRNDYAVGPITESVEITDVSATGRELSARVEWSHEAAGYFQWGVPAHTIDGDPILSFIWEDAPQGVREMFSDTERVGGDPRVFFRSVDHPGIPTSGYVRAASNWLQQEFQS
jgi:hypothetical protein